MIKRLSIYAGWYAHRANADEPGYTYALTPEIFDALRCDAQSVLIDVRAQAEFMEERIPGAFNLDASDPAFWFEISRYDKKKTYLLYCRNGYLSSLLCLQMASRGFHAYALSGGISRWQGPVYD